LSDQAASGNRPFWPEEEDVAGVVLCGGAGNRLFPLTLQHQKTMLPVAGRPLLHYVLAFWKPFVTRFVFVVKYHREEIEEYVATLPFSCQCVEPEALRGIADGIYQARALVGERFIVILGDCVCRGRLQFPSLLDQGVVIWATDNPEDIRRSYSVELKENRLVRVVEKPQHLPNNLCGTGFYFFHRRIFDYIERQPPSALRGEKEITDVIQAMIDAGEIIAPIWLEGAYVNVTFPEDLQRAEHVLLSCDSG